MIIYERDKKELIVPATFAGGGDSDCGPAVEKAYEEGWNEGWQSGWTGGYASGSSECSGSCNIQQTKYIYVNDRPTAGEVFIEPDEGYDGVFQGVANIDNALDKFYNEGYAAGSATSCNLQEGRYYVPVWPNGSSGEVNILPDEGYDGFSNFRINDWDGLWSYYSAGSESVRSQFTTLNVSGNGIYECSGDAAYNVVNVNIDSVGFYMTLSGTATFDRDIMFSRDQGDKATIQVFLESTNLTREWLDEPYIFIDGVSLAQLRDNNTTISAGTHTITADINQFASQQTYFQPFTVNSVVAFTGESSTPDVHFDYKVWYSRAR
jgi:hypothetical protein